MVLFGRNSESPVPVVAASTPSGCFDAAIEAARIAVKYRTPVFLLSDAYLANGSEPWLIPDVATLPDISTTFATEPNDEAGFLPYRRDPATLARPWAIPGHPGSSIGSADSRRRTRRQRLVRPGKPRSNGATARGQGRRDRGRHPRARGRRSRRRRHARPRLGSTYGAIGAATRRVRASGRKVATTHLHHLNPFPRRYG